MTSTFWATHQVGGPYPTLEESERALADRERQYPGLYDLMPVNLPGKTILDFGCGPGHDTILFLEHGAEQVWFADSSPLALKITSDRLKMHNLLERARPVLLSDRRVPVLPYADHIHCAGVLHHTANPLDILHSFRTALLPGGEIRLMVYDGDKSPHSQSEVPITRWWTRAEVVALAARAGMAAEYVGGYPCEAEWRPGCWAACYRLT